MTRFPKSGKGHRWTVAELKALSPESAGDTLREGDGLVRTVRGAGAGPVTVHFRYGFKRDGKKAWHYCGTSPTGTKIGILRDMAQPYMAAKRRRAVGVHRGAPFRIFRVSRSTSAQLRCSRTA